MAIIESNQMRRAHRVDIPLTVVIDKKAYRTKDWSMTGVGIENLDREMQKDEIISASLVLALQDARIEMPVSLQFKINRDNISGFEFHKIAEKNKRVLKEFLELSIEGRLNQTDNLISIYNEPIIDTPIKESVVLFQMALVMSHCIKDKSCASSTKTTSNLGIAVSDFVNSKIMSLKSIKLYSFL